MTDASPLTEGVGARLPRKEDDRLMRGRGQYVGDLRLPGLQDVAFVRSPLAHARIRAIQVPEAYRGQVFTAADLADVQPIRAVSGLAGFKVSEQPVLAKDKVRQVGELLAICLAPTRAAAISSASRNCRRSTTCRRPARRAPPWSTSTGATTSSWRPPST
jgi:carbon-monoxide dehydrogenase large subunit